MQDYQTTCQQMGYEGGRYVQWMDRVNSSSSRPLLLENPRCYPASSSLFDCDWESRKVGAGVCGKLAIELSRKTYGSHPVPINRIIRQFFFSKWPTFLLLKWNMVVSRDTVSGMGEKNVTDGPLRKS